MTASILADRLRAAREARGLSQSRLARLADVATSTVNRIERGERIPRVDVLARLAAELGVSVDDLLAPHRRRRRAAA